MAFFRAWRQKREPTVDQRPTNGRMNRRGDESRGPTDSGTCSRTRHGST